MHQQTNQGPLATSPSLSKMFIFFYLEKSGFCYSLKLTQNPISAPK